MSTMISTTRLHFNKREVTFLIPLYITGVVAVISVLISFLFWRSGSLPGTPGWVQGSQSNPGIAWALAGFLVYLGVQSVATTFPFALTLGEKQARIRRGDLSVECDGFRLSDARVRCVDDGRGRDRPLVL